MAKTQRLPDPVHNVVQLACATMGVALLMIALIDWIDHITTLEMALP